MLPTYFLRLALEIGGTPHKVTTDFGTETVQMGAYQMWLSSRYAGITIEEAETQMHFTKSTLNQKIEGLWSQMMKQHNWSVIAIIKEEIHWGGYQAADQVQKLLFLSLWIPIFQSSVDMCIDAYNLTRRRRDHLTSLPTACTADFCYSTPKSFATTGQLVPVPANKLNLMIVKDFPDCVEMFQHTPVWFDQLRHRILKRIGIKLTDITVGTVWTVFHQMLPLVEAEVDRQSCSPSD
ncbi:hypothetical protein PSTG_04789 [Puccinia striiformis f. sp. tritici PST-78]|uniref:Uncharacterized protein n=1 Tax=Puccinia striiformis f. sp. tritici PST-78 TaxID=1165861 RepID=A0A0L0VSL1_9BASI|nr:hypothetical protein PSTG_04789 [Puccinia striiformis f. sp. tritici PST-78]